MVNIRKAVRFLIQVVGFVLVFQLFIMLRKPVYTKMPEKDTVQGLEMENSTILTHLMVNNINNSPTSHSPEILQDLPPVNYHNASKVDSLRSRLNLDGLQSSIKVSGQKRNYTGFLTIGIPSIRRPVGSLYLLNTIKSIIDQSIPAERLKATVVIFLADLDQDYNDQVLQIISEKYGEYMNMGFIQVIQVAPELYPNLDSLKHNYGDSDSRVKWRAKQAADFAFMIKYSENISKYYLQIEDDVACAARFIDAVEKFIASKVKEQWAVMDFSNMGFIGKLMKSEDLDKFAVFLMTFYEEQPVDWLLDYFRLTMAQKTKLVRRPSLFEHLGQKSSYVEKQDWKIRSSKVKTIFQSEKAKVASLNPKAIIVSTMKAYGKYAPENAYLYKDEIFWSVEPSKGDEYHIVLTTEQKLTRLSVTTGSPEKPNDILRMGTVYVSSSVEKLAQLNNEVRCGDPKVLGKFENGRLDFNTTGLNSEISTMLVKCITISADADQKDWVIFRNIIVR